MRQSIRFVLLSLLVVIPTALQAQKNCKKGKPCGGTCIAVNKTCHVGAPTSAPAPEPAKPALSTVAQQGAEGAEWVASKQGRTYYKAGCSGAKDLAKENLIYFKNEADAKAAGLTHSKQKGC